MNERKPEPWMPGAAEALAPGVHLVLGWRVGRETAMAALMTAEKPTLTVVFAKGNAEAVIGVSMAVLREGGKEPVTGSGIPGPLTIEKAVAAMKDLGLGKLVDGPPQFWMVDDRR